MFVEEDEGGRPALKCMACGYEYSGPLPVGMDLAKSAEHKGPHLRNDRRQRRR
jgi:hypothetical protein